jgi:acyl-CoA reductase-like NAD-dependent aldehyde dehydrogenase
MEGPMTTFASINPHRPSDVVVEAEAAGPRGVDAAVSSAGSAFGSWAREPAPTRGAALAAIAADLERRASEVAELVVREVGKPVGEARGEIARGVAILRYHAQTVLLPDGETYPSTDGASWLLARRRPVGVCALITPWNFPVAIPLWKLAPAVGYGNTAVLKPAPHATATAQLLAAIASQHLPDGVLRLALGDAETGGPLVDHPDVAAVSFTGSVAVGQSIAAQAAGRGARVQCEMGGQNASVVLADADLGAAADTISFAAMGYAGQKCTATSRVIVESSVYEEFRDRLVAAVEDMGVVDPSSESCEVGPLIEDEARSSALGAIEASGGRVAAGGEALAEDGFYLAPTLVEVADPADVLAQEEVFAPVAALLRAASAEDAIRLANGVRYGLVAAVFTRDLGRAIEFTSSLDAGLVRANAPTSGVDFHAPFGGSKASSIGPREQGLAARDFYTETHTMLVSP